MGADSHVRRELIEVDISVCLYDLVTVDVDSLVGIHADQHWSNVCLQQQHPAGATNYGRRIYEWSVLYLYAQINLSTVILTVSHTMQY